MVERGITILLVEDEAIVALSLKKSLVAEGYEVCGSAANGETAVRLAGEQRPDIVLMDIRLAGKMDGVEAASTIVARHNTPIIFMTGYPDDSMTERAQALSPVAILRKPIDFDHLGTVLYGFFKSKKNS